MRRSIRLALLFAVAFGSTLAGCTYQGGVQDPITRKFTWFSYLAGDDIKAHCAPGQPAQYRLVYNAVWNEQVRAYDLKRSATGTGAILFSHVFGSGGTVASVDLSDLTAPWRGATADTRLDEQTYVALITTIESSGFGGAPPVGEYLSSWGFYWAVSACAEGKFHFNAWIHPSDRFDRITFNRFLFANDRTGVPVYAPRPVNAAEYRARSGAYRNDVPDDFELKVGPDGLVGRLTIF